MKVNNGEVLLKDEGWCLFHRINIFAMWVTAAYAQFDKTLQLCVVTLRMCSKNEVHICKNNRNFFCTSVCLLIIIN